MKQPSLTRKDLAPTHRTGLITTEQPATEQPATEYRGLSRIFIFFALDLYFHFAFIFNGGFIIVNN